LAAFTADLLLLWEWLGASFPNTSPGKSELLSEGRGFDICFGFYTHMYNSFKTQSCLTYFSL